MHTCVYVCVHMCVCDLLAYHQRLIYTYICTCIHAYTCVYVCVCV